MFAYMSAVWPAERTDEQVAVWLETMLPLDGMTARMAVRELKGTKTFWPSHAEFVAAVEDHQRRHLATTTPPQVERSYTECHRCRDTGWINEGDPTDHSGWTCCTCPMGDDPVTVRPVYDHRRVILEAIKGGRMDPTEGVKAVTADVEARRRHRGPLSPQVCAFCDGTGWEVVPVVGQAEAVRRCWCQRSEEDEHKSGCSCLACSYGPRRAGSINRGTDGVAPVSVDALCLRPKTQYTQEEF